MPGRIEVEPDALIAAGQIVLTAGEQLSALSEAVKPMVAEGLASGYDLAGFNMGVQYGRQSQEFTNTLAGAANAFKSVGYRLMASGYNYRNADEASTIGGPGPSGGLGPAPQESHPGQAARMPQNLLVPPPPKWNLITMFLPVNTWPNGHAGLMKVTAAQWRNFANGFKVFDSMLTAPKAVVGAQHIDESGKMQESLTALGENIKTLTDISDNVAKAVEDYANQVQETQNAIRRILNRLSLDGLFDAAKDILTGDGMKLVREVADNIKALWHNFQTNVKAITGLLGEALTLLGEAADAFQKMIRPVLIAAFGEEIGGALAEGIKFYTDVQVGLISGLVGTVSGLVSLADFDTWKGMYDVATMIAKDPSKTDDVLIAMGKQFVALDKWSGDHPGRALGEAGFNIGSLFVPGGALSKTGSVAKGAKLAKDLASGERKLSDLAKFGPRGRGLADAGDHDGLGGLDNLSSHTQTPRFDAGAMPEIGDAPRPPTIGDSPGGTPRGLGGPPDPPGPDHTPVRPGGDGPGQHAGPPERPSGPADSGPSRHDGPQSSSGPAYSGDGPQSSSGAGTNGQGSHGPSADGPRSSEPPAAAHTPSDSSGPSQSQHSPQNSTDTSTHDQGNSSPTHDQRGSHDTAGAGETGGHTPSDTGHRSDADSRPSDHSSGAERHSNGGDSRTHDSPTTDGTHRTDHTAPSHVTDAPAHRETGTDGPTNSLANAMNMGGPIGPVGHPGGHAPGSHGPSPTSSHTPAANTERPAGTPTPRDSTPNNSPPQRSPERTNAGPARDTNPSPPVKPAAAQGESHVPERKQPGTEQPQRPSAPTEPDRGSGPHTGHSPAEQQPTHEPRTTDATHDRIVQPTEHSENKPSHSTDEQRHTPKAAQPEHHADPTPEDNPDHTTNGDQSSNPPGPVGNPADARSFGPHELDKLENPAYQTAVEDALRSPDDPDKVIKYADPRTNEYGTLINDGGPEQLGRADNCIDCTLSGLSSFLGDPTVSVPRHPDKLPDGTDTYDVTGGERGGVKRATDWLGDRVFSYPGESVTGSYQKLHDYINSLGPGSAAFVATSWHARDLLTGEKLFHPDGAPVRNGGHATAIVFPEGADGPVWWDPQHGLTSDHPPPYLTENASLLQYIPIEPDRGGHHAGPEHDRTSDNLSGSDVAERDLPRATDAEQRMAVHEDADRGPRELEHGNRLDEAGDRRGDGDHLRVSELAGDDGRGGLHKVQGDGNQQGRPTDLSASVADRDPSHDRGSGDDHLSADRDFSGQPSGGDPSTSADHREAHVRGGTEGRTVADSAVTRGVDESPEQRNLAGDGHDRVLTGIGHDQHQPPHDGARGVGEDRDHHESDSTPTHHDGPQVPEHYVELADGTQHRVWASSEHLQSLPSRFDAADAWLAERGLTRADVQPLLVQPADWLNAAQRELVYGFRHEFPDVAHGETLQKVTDVGQAESRLAGGAEDRPPSATGGSVSVARDTRDLTTPERIYDGLALEYPDTPFAPDKPAIAMRFTVADGVPVHLPDQQLSRLAGHGDSFDPGYGYPFTGTGFTASDHFAVPEYFLAGGTRMNPGSEMYRIDPDGTESLLAVLDAGGRWVKVKDG